MTIKEAIELRQYLLEENNPHKTMAATGFLYLWERNNPEPKVLTESEYMELGNHKIIYLDWLEARNLETKPERFRQAVKRIIETGLYDNYAGVAELLGIKLNRFKEIMSGRLTPYLEEMELLECNFYINPAWYRYDHDKEPSDPMFYNPKTSKGDNVPVRRNPRNKTKAEQAEEERLYKERKEQERLQKLAEEQERARREAEKKREQERLEAIKKEQQSRDVARLRVPTDYGMNAIWNIHKLMSLNETYRRKLAEIAPEWLAELEKVEERLDEPHEEVEELNESICKDSEELPF